jgi:exonuclease SbcD
MSNTKPYRILHTSDWHLGNSLKDKDRSAEFESFLNWLLGVLESKEVDALIVAGDIFDVVNPGHKAQELYYQFLAKVSSTGCKHVVITAGNHDSASLLDAPKEILSALSVSVVGNVSKEALDKQIIELKDSGETKMIVCAVPYLREAALREFAKETANRDIAKLVIDGTTQHYKELGDRVQAMGLPSVPVVATGHLFAAKVTGDQDKELREVVGNLGLIEASVFPDVFDYVALGHIHRPQMVGASNKVRYSGAPLLMGFNETKQSRSVYLVDFPKNQDCVVSAVEVPVFQAFERVQGDLKTIKSALSKLKESNSNAYVEVIYESEVIINNLGYELKDYLNDVPFTVVSLENRSFLKQIGILDSENIQDLQEMTELEVFETLLNRNEELTEGTKTELVQVFKELLVIASEEE